MKLLPVRMAEMGVKLRTALVLPLLLALSIFGCDRPAEVTDSAAVIALQNFSEESLPGLKETSEEALLDLLISLRLEASPRSDVQRLLPEARLNPRGIFADPRSATLLGRRLGADFVLTGRVLDYQVQGSLHAMSVELIVVDMETAQVRFQETLVSQRHGDPNRKQHGELLTKLLDEARPALGKAMGLPIGTYGFEVASDTIGHDARAVSYPRGPRGTATSTADLDWAQSLESQSRESPLDLLARGHYLLDAGKQFAARSHFALAQRRAFDAGDYWTEAAAWEGLCQQPVGDGLVYCHLALDFYRRVGEQNREVRTRLILGDLYLMRGDAENALEQFQAAFRLLESSGDEVSQIESREGLGRGKIMLGRLEEGRAELSTAKDGWRQAGDLFAERRVLGWLAKIDYELGRLEDAGSHLERVVEISEELRPLDPSVLSRLFARNRVGIAPALEAMEEVAVPGGDLHSSMSTQEQSSAAVYTTDAYLAVVSRLAYGEERQGEAHPSVDWQQIEIANARVSEINARYESSENSLGPEATESVCVYFDQSRVLADLAGVLSRQGRLGRAGSAIESAWDAWWSTTYSLQDELSETLDWNARSANSEIGARLASVFQDALGSGMLGLPPRDLLDFARQAGRLPPPPAPGFSQICGATFSLSEETLWRADTLLSKGDPDSAEELFEGVAEEGDHLQKVAAMAGLARCSLAKGEWEEAVGRYRMAIDQAETLLTGLRLEPIAFAGLQARLYGEMIDLLAERGDVTLAFAYSERARAHGFRRKLRGSPLELAAVPGPLADDLSAVESRILELRTRREVVRRDPSRNATVVRGSLAAVLQEAEREREQLVESVRLANPEAASLVDFEPIDLASLQRTLEPSTTLVSFFLLEEKALTWLITRDRFEMVVLPVSRAELESRAARLMDLVGVRRFDDTEATALHELLIDPLASKLESGDLLLIPHGPLHQVPFAALRDAEGRSLIERHPLVFAPSATTLGFLGQKQTPWRGRALVLGDPDRTLPHAAAEARAVAAGLGVTPNLGSEAKRELVLRQAGQVDLLHIAAHGVQDNFQPELSHLRLAPAGPGGQLTVRDIYGLRLEEANLVVLSACDTASGHLTDGDDLIGLTRAFLAAGAPTVLTTLWPIDDSASAALMTSFYRHLGASGNAASSLRAAQLEVMKEPAWNSPYYWAGFVLSGDSEEWRVVR